MKNIIVFVLVCVFAIPVFGKSTQSFVDARGAFAALEVLQKNNKELSLDSYKAVVETGLYNEETKTSVVVYPGDYWNLQDNKIIFVSKGQVIAEILLEEKKENTVVSSGLPESVAVTDEVLITPEDSLLSLSYPEISSFVLKFESDTSISRKEKSLYWSLWSKNPGFRQMSFELGVIYSIQSKAGWSNEAIYDKFFTDPMIIAPAMPRDGLTAKEQEIKDFYQNLFANMKNKETIDVTEVMSVPAVHTEEVKIEEKSEQEVDRISIDVESEQMLSYKKSIIRSSDGATASGIFKEIEGLGSSGEVFTSTEGEILYAVERSKKKKTFISFNQGKEKLILALKKGKKLKIYEFSPDEIPEKIKKEDLEFFASRNSR